MSIFIRRVRRLRGMETNDLNAVLARINDAEYTIGSAAGSLFGNSIKREDDESHD